MIALHGYGGDAHAIQALRLDRYPARAAASGVILDEVLPHLERLGLRTDRFGLIGWSPGGYGALLMAAATT